jgi:hypothetical protein
MRKRTAVSPDVYRHTAPEVPPGELTDGSPRVPPVAVLETSWSFPIETTASASITRCTPRLYFLSAASSTFARRIASPSRSRDRLALSALTAFFSSFRDFRHFCSATENASHGETGEYLAQQRATQSHSAHAAEGRAD